jgi:glutamate synthase domain-containing protein 1/glutamate synthase domain-containing protein 3
MSQVIAEKILASRDKLLTGLPVLKRSEDAAEGGCGVLGFAANIPVAGRHVLTASNQMHNRGNGKGGGVAMAGLDPHQVGVDRVTLRSHYLLQIALLDASARQEVENQYIDPYFHIAQAYELEHLPDFRNIPGLVVRPPDVWRYFVRVKPQALAAFAAANGMEDLPNRAVEDEFVFQNTFRLNRQFYASLGEQRAFVLSHGRNLSVLKIVGYAEDVVAYYQLEDQTAHVWVAHQRYPTKGRVWHPGGAHPFIGLNEALVHNGDFANYHAVSEYLRQRNIGQLFLTDTEVSVQLFDLWDRVYGYPLEITLEAMAPTSEHDFAMLEADKQALYRAVQRTHIHGSPDGPWFFILARSLGDDWSDHFELLGITDTSMLRPQVFALYENHAQAISPSQADNRVQIGLIASERQAINACLRSLATEDARFQPVADKYWVARGGSHTDGGAFRFKVNVPASVTHTSSVSAAGELTCTNKYGEAVRIAPGRWHVNSRQLEPQQAPVEFRRWWEMRAMYAFDDGGASTMWRWLKSQMPTLTWDELAWGLDWMVEFGQHGDDEWDFSLASLNYLRDRRYYTGRKKRASILKLVDESLVNLFDRTPLVQLTRERKNTSGLSGLERIRRLNWETLGSLNNGELSKDAGEQDVLVVDTLGFPPEGNASAARWILRIYEKGWRRVIAYNWRGGRFAACGLGADSQGMRIDLYGDVGDYTASGLDGAEVFVHGDGQDQLGQIMKRGKLVIYGDAGQTFLYGAKGGEVYVLGCVAGRPLINAVGKPRAVINGTCLDYLAESFMAGDPLQGGGFVILNGMAFDESGRLVELESPYPGSNLFSLASGGAIYLRDPHRRVVDDQLNGGAFAELSAADWALIEPYLRENGRLFGIQIDDLLNVQGEKLPPALVYRKVEVREAGVLSDQDYR